MIKKLIVALVIALPLSVLAQKFGIVDADVVMQAMPEYATMQTQLAEVSKQYEDEYAKLQEEMNKKYAEFQKLDQDAATPQAIKERRIQDIQELDQKIQQFLQAAQEDLQRQRMQLLSPIQQRFVEAVEAVGKEGGFVFIMPLGVSYYNGDTVEDVTNLVKAKLGIQ